MESWRRSTIAAVGQSRGSKFDGAMRSSAGSHEGLKADNNESNQDIYTRGHALETTTFLVKRHELHVACIKPIATICTFCTLVRDESSLVPNGARLGLHSKECLLFVMFLVSTPCCCRQVGR